MTIDPRDSFPVPGMSGDRPEPPRGRGGRELFEQIPGLEDLLPAGFGDAASASTSTSARLSDDATDGGAEDAAATGPPEAPPPSRAAAMLDRMRRRYEDDEDARAAPPAARASAAPQAARREPASPFGSELPDNPFEVTGSGPPSPDAGRTGTVQPPAPRRSAPARQGAEAEAEDDRFAVMLDPAGQVNVDALIEVMAGFLGVDARTARRTIRRGKGLLAVGLTRSEALILESALHAERQPVVAMRIEPRMIHEPPRRVEKVRAGARRVIVDHPDREVELPPDEFFLLHAGLLRESPEDARPGAQPAAVRHLLVADFFGRSQAGCWRWEVPITAEDAARGDRSPAVRSFCEAMAGLRSLLLDVQRTPVFDTIADRTIDPRHVFADRESLENYELWQLWTRLGASS